MCLISVPSYSSTPNPHGIHGSFVSVLNSETPHVVPIGIRSTSGVLSPATFLYNFTVSDSCRVSFAHSGTVFRFRTASGDEFSKYINLVSGTIYNIGINADELTIYRAGLAVTITFDGVVEYE